MPRGFKPMLLYNYKILQCHEYHNWSMVVLITSVYILCWYSVQYCAIFLGYLWVHPHFDQLRLTIWKYQFARPQLDLPNVLVDDPTSDPSTNTMVEYNWSSGRAIFSRWMSYINIHIEIYIIYKIRYRICHIIFCVLFRSMKLSLQFHDASNPTAWDSLWDRNSFITCCCINLIS